jgi:DNA-directed RNA polymerase specialized sigma24 family protein
MKLALALLGISSYLLAAQPCYKILSGRAGESALGDQRFSRLAHLLKLVKADPASVNEAWNELVSEFTPDLKAYFRWRGTSTDLIEDRVQDTFLRILVKAPGFEPDLNPAESAGRFMFGLAKTVHLSSDTRRWVGLPYDVPDRCGNEGPFDGRTLAELLETEGQRSVMNLFLQRYSVEEIAALLGIPPSEVRELYASSEARARSVLGVSALSHENSLVVPFTSEQANLLRLRAGGATQTEIAQLTGKSIASVNRVLSRDVRRKILPVLKRAGVTVPNARYGPSLREISFQVDPLEPAIIHVAYQAKNNPKVTRLEGREMNQRRVQIGNYLSTDQDPRFEMPARILPRVLMHFQPESRKYIESWASGKTLTDIAFETGSEIGNIREVISNAARRVDGDWFEITLRDFDWILQKLIPARQNWARSYFLHGESPYGMQRAGRGDAKTIYAGLHQVSRLITTYAENLGEGTSVNIDIWRLVVVPDEADPELNRIALHRF